MSETALSRVQAVAGELAQLTQRRHDGDLVALVHTYIMEAQQAGILPVRPDGAMTDADCELLYEFLHHQAILASQAASNAVREIYAEAHGHVCRAATSQTPERVYMHLRLANTAIDMLARGVRLAQADAANLAAAGGVRQ